MKVQTKFFQANADKVWDYYIEYDWADRKYRIGADATSQLFDFADWLEECEDEDLARISELPEEFMPDLRHYMNKSLNNYFRSNEPLKVLQDEMEAAQ